MIKEKLGHRLDGWIHTFFPFLFWRPINPDWLTLAGTLIAGSAGLAFAEGAHGTAGCLLLTGGFFDLVDGAVARHFGISTRFGAFLDSSLDRVVDVAAMLGLVTFFARANEPSGVLLCSLILVATVLTSYTKARAELIVARMPGGLLERGERIGLLAVGSILDILWPILWILAIGTVVTVVQRILYAYREMGRLDREQRSERVEEAN
ncbi:MAG: CDP-alcohol phosphatidyltransferase family protein [Myxococcota bacterium]